MTVLNENTKKSYAGDGTNNPLPTTFDYFDFDIIVTQRTVATGVEVVLVKDTHYTLVAGTGGEGNVVPIAGATDFQTGIHEWTLLRSTPATQDSAYGAVTVFPAAVHEKQLDRAAMRDAEQDEKLGRAVVIPITDPATVVTTLPNSIDRASKFAAWDALGNWIASSGSIPATIAVSLFMETVVGAANAAAARTLLVALEDVVTTQGDIIIGGVAGATTRLPMGVAGASLVAGAASQPIWDFATSPGFISGCQVTISGDEITVGVGTAAAFGIAPTAMRVVSPIVKNASIADWAEGSGSAIGGRPTAVPYAVNDTFHVFLIQKDDNTVDVGIDNVTTAANLLNVAGAAWAAGYRRSRLIMSVQTETTPTLIAQRQNGDEVLWDDPGNARNLFAATNPGTGEQTPAILVPSGLKVEALLAFQLDTSGVGSTAFARVTDPDLTTPGVPAYNLNDAVSEGAFVNLAISNLSVRTNLLSQIRYQLSFSSAFVDVGIRTMGYRHPRGKEGA